MAVTVRPLEPEDSGPLILVRALEQIGYERLPDREWPELFLQFRELAREALAAYNGGPKTKECYICKEPVRLGEGWWREGKAWCPDHRPYLYGTSTIIALVAHIEELEHERWRVTSHDYKPRPGEELDDLRVLLGRGDWSVPWVRGAVGVLFARVEKLTTELARAEGERGEQRSAHAPSW